MTKLLPNPYFEPVDYKESKGRNNVENKYTKKKISERREFVAQRSVSHATVIDVGCAEGEFIRELSKIGFDSKKIFGVEPSLDAQDIKDFTIFKQNPTDKKFDLITCFHVLEHITDPQKFILELAEMMHPKSKLILEVPNGTGHPLIKEEKNVEHAFLFTVQSLLGLLLEADLDVLELHTKKFESPGYRDNIRVVAKTKKQFAGFELPEGPISIFGTGGDYAKYVEPLSINISYYFDRHEKRLSKDVNTVKYSKDYREEKILISSLHYEDEIYNYLIKNKHPQDNILLLSDLLMNIDI